RQPGRAIDGLERAHSHDRVTEGERETPANAPTLPSPANGGGNLSDVDVAALEGLLPGDVAVAHDDPVLIVLGAVAAVGHRDQEDEIPSTINRGEAVDHRRRGTRAGGTDHRQQ